MALLWITCVISCPIYGIIIDKFGLRSRFAIFSCLIGLGGLIFILFMHPFIPVMMIGTAFSANYASAWVSIVYVVEKEHIGTAFALGSCLQNLGTTIVPPMVAHLINTFRSYDAVTEI